MFPEPKSLNPGAPVTKLFLSIMTAILVVFLVSPDAHARRFGGGMNFGKSYKYSRQARPWRPARSDRRNGSQQSRPSGAGRGRFAGPLAGLAAGGLIGAMLFGGAFNGIQLLDLLVIGFLGFLGFRLFRALAGAGRQPAYARAGGGGPAQFRRAQTSTPDTRIPVPEIGAALEGQALSVSPDWFDETAFVDEAKQHFLRLQRAWDSGDLDEIRAYVTPEFYRALRDQLASRIGHEQTRVQHLSVQLLDLLEDGDRVVAAILYSGEISEDGRPARPFAEIWHVEHAAKSAEGDWRIAGIRQYPGPELDRNDS